MLLLHVVALRDHAVILLLATEADNEAPARLVILVLFLIILLIILFLLILLRFGLNLLLTGQEPTLLDRLFLLFGFLFLLGLGLNDLLSLLWLRLR